MEADSDFRPWNELIPDTLGLIFSNLEAQEILQVIPLVCKSWCKVVEGPYCWQRIDTGHFLHDTWLGEVNVEEVLRALIPRSSGSLRELCVSIIDDHMLSFIAEYAGSLQTLELIDSAISDSGLELFLKASTSLTSLVIRDCSEITMPSLEAIKRNCKRLESLTLDGFQPWQVFKKTSHDEAESIMPNLKRLSLQYAMMDDSSILCLLSCCPELEWVQIRGAYDLTLDPRVVKEKYPNILTLDISDVFVSDSDYGSYSYGSVDWYDGYCESDDNLHWNYEYDNDDYVFSDYE